MKLIATAAFGLESVVGRELSWLGYDQQQTENGRVIFEGDLEAICRTNLWLRCADRILLLIGRFPADSFEALFQGTKGLPWEHWIPENGAFPVTGKSVKSKLFSVPDCQAIVKKAIVERLKTIYRRDWFDETGPVYKVEVSLLNDIACLTIDTSGAGLHKRGYREEAGPAPLKETLACGLLYISRWKPDRALLDPFCGSGTIPIEAAMIGMNLAPGLHRTFLCETWPCMPDELWQDLRAQALRKADRSRELRIYASDRDYFALSLAKRHAALAGVENHIHFQKVDYRVTSSRYRYGFIVTNPPYGQRLADKEETEMLYRGMGSHFQTFDTWSYYILASHPNFETLFGRKADKKRKLYNGRILCQYYQYYGPKPSLPESSGNIGQPM